MEEKNEKTITLSVKEINEWIKEKLSAKYPNWKISSLHYVLKQEYDGSWPEDYPTTVFKGTEVVMMPK